MIWSEYVETLANLLVVPADDERFAQLLPWITQSAELRILREPTFDFLSTRGASIQTGPTVPGDRSVALPDRLVVVQQASILTPANTTGASARQIPMLRVTKEYIDNIWPQAQVTQAPQPFQMLYAIRNQGNEDPQILIAPTPNDSYYVNLYGTSRPTGLSAGNPQTFISRELPDLFVAAAAVIACGAVLKNFGAAADSPEQALSWNAAYDQIKAGISIESMRQRAVSSGWSEFPPAPLAGSPRGAPLAAAG